MKLDLAWLRILWWSLVWFGWGFSNEAWFGLAEDSLMKTGLIRLGWGFSNEACFGLAEDSLMKLGLVWLRILWRSLVWFGWGFTNEAWFGLAEDSLLNLRILRCRFEVCFGGGFSGVDSKYGLVWLTILRVWRWSTGRIILKIFLLQGINTKPDQKGGGWPLNQFLF